MLRKIPYGISDFKKIRQNNFYFIDKSLLIEEVLQSGVEVILLPRPRRFGKTLNLSMLHYFFERNEPSFAPLFEGLKIVNHTECMKHQGCYPVIFLTFKDQKERSYEMALRGLSKLIGVEYRRHSAILESPAVSSFDKREFEKICQCEADEVDLKNSLLDLCRALATVYQRKPIVLIDEYDTPIHAGVKNGYYSEIIDFFTGFLGAALKDNPYLEKSIITGILRISKESIFSGLNNLDVCSVLSKRFSDYFGLLESEVSLLLSDFGMDTAGQMETVREWYNGYRFEEKVIYNPWSVLGYVHNYPAPPSPYWTNTSSNDLIKDLIQKNLFDYSEVLEQLIQGFSVPCAVAEDTVLPEIEKSASTLWSFLLFTGYLTGKNRRIEANSIVYDLAIPNLEVRLLFHTTIKQWFEEKRSGQSIPKMLQALVQGEVDAFVASLQRLVIATLSTHDTASNFVEIAGHMFVLGLLVNLDGQFAVRSNREAGLGRYDIALEPQRTQDPAFLFEFKAVKGSGEEAIQTATVKALEQIHQRQYCAELLTRGVQKICCIALVFEGKTIHHQFEWVGNSEQVEQSG